MIHVLASRYPRHIACILAVIFLHSLMPVYGNSLKPAGIPGVYRPVQPPGYNNISQYGNYSFSARDIDEYVKYYAPVKKERPEAPDTGGPSQPEMSSFKSVGTDNMVNLFTGDFSYNIPLLDVGGYPVNIFYDGGISPEQEASWVGLGWNINPGTVNRNMRGVPDDFNGEDILIQTQDMKANKTWGITLNADLEALGIKNVLGTSIDLRLMSLGISFNNYLGPALELGFKGGANFSIAPKAGSEKSTAALTAGLSIGANLSSRNGLTIAPNFSLTANAFKQDKTFKAGIGLSTSYNSRSGIRQLQISEQMSYSYGTQKKVGEDKDKNPIYKDGGSSMGATLASATISFAKPSYVPSVRMPLNNEAYSGHFQLGGGIFGTYGSMEAEVYRQTAKVAAVVQEKPMVGYLYYQNANNNPNAVMDFTRLNDNEVTRNTPVISAPEYSYDVFSIQGEGTGGAIRPYRNDMGYVRDNITQSKDNSLGIGGDIGIPGHYGANFNTIQTPTVISEWNFGNNLRNVTGFVNATDTFENVYFRNPGETTVLHPEQFNKIGGTDLVRFKLGGTDAIPTIEPVLERFSKSNTLTGVTPLLTTNDPRDRKKRTQVTGFLNAYDAARMGLDKTIRNYNGSTVLESDTLKYSTIERVSEYRKQHHISEINVTEISGRRYVYGIPVYNVIQKDFSFTVDGTGSADDLVNTTENEATTLKTNTTRNSYLQITETPPYAHAFLLTGLLSPDYVDVTGDGITEDDLGNAVKFNYTRYADHKWRTPHTGGAQATANFNAGNLSENEDDKGLISYGERESWYLHSIESKTMIALFTVENRNDGKGPIDEYRGVNGSDNSLKRLEKIDLYNKADLKKNGLVNALPVKTVWFAYSYSLCPGTPDNATGGGGKLTLDSIYFTFNGKPRDNKSKYAFYYTNEGAGNPSYEYNASDRWGNYKPKSQNPGGVKNRDYPYALQDKTLMDQNAAAWSLKKILLPSGGQIEVEYESDDYAYVQNRRAAAMMEIAGLGPDAFTITDNLYGVSPASPFGFVEYDYVFINVPDAGSGKTEVLQKYLQGVTQLAFKLAVNMPGGVEYIPCYATIADYGKYDATHIWIQLNRVDGLSPLTLAALDYLRERLPGQAFPGYNVTESGGLKQVGQMLAGMWDGLKSAFKDPVRYLRSEGRVKTIVPANSFVRLNDPDGFKYGGGQRVRAIKLKDNWQAMTQQYTAEYGQEYDYKTTEIFNGTERPISSGVASYEPSIGGEENPFRSVVQVKDKLPLGPASYGAIEMPVLDAFFPAPIVGYSKVTVRSVIKKRLDTVSRSGIGRQVTEFYTAKDFPVYYNHTSFDPGTDKQEHQASVLNFFYKYAFDSRALSQGFLVEINDMHGKMKSQSSFAANDTTARINYTEHFYRNTGSKGLNEKFDFVHASQGGLVQEGNMGIDIELMTDTREFSVKSTSFEVQGQVDLFPVLLPFWLPFIWPVAGESENTYRAVTTTKVISYHGILDSVVVIDKGSQVSTRNLVYDSETGDVVVTRTNNEYDQPVYSVKYPAWWAYSGMGPAYKNSNAIYSGINFYDGKMTNGSAFEQLVIESGDELYITTQGAGSSGCVVASGEVEKLWAFDKNKNTTALTVPVKDLVYLDKNGKLYTGNGVSFRIVRSGKRNMLEAPAASVSLMSDPVVEVAANTHKLVINSSSKVINASAVEYREKWQTDNESIKKYSLVFNTAACRFDEVENCNGYYEKSINPYRKGLVGNFRPWRNMVFYGDRAETTPVPETNLPQYGFLSNFGLYWDFDANSNLVPNYANTQWIWNEQATRFNSRSMELETKNALDIYTAAQYGYNKTLPTAIAGNSRYHEMFYDGFEDYDYAETLNDAAGNICAKRHIDFTGLANAQIVNTDIAGFNAHTGKYVLGVNALSTTSKSITVNYNPNLYDYAIETPPLTTGSLYDLGVFNTSIPFYYNGSTDNLPPLGYSFNPSSGFLCQISPTVYVQYNGVYYLINLDYQLRTSQYYEIKEEGYYDIHVLKQSVFRLDAFGMSAKIYDNATNSLVYTILTQSSTQHTGSLATNATICLPKGIYRVDFEITEHLAHTCTSGSSQGCYTFPNTLRTIDGRSLSFTLKKSGTNNSLPGYENLSINPECTLTQPVAGSASMLNPAFTIPVNKKMLFSAWVREQCGDPANGVPCTSEGYINNQVNLQYTGGSSQVLELKPSGPIIEGWQRYEGEFIPPLGATQMTMSLVNNSSSTIYFDDIRIHPFNANMKSYVYDPVNLRLVAELDANNYASFYEYDEEGGLIRTKAETREGIKTINETRSFQQRGIKNVQ